MDSQKTTNELSGSPTGGRYQEMGVGNTDVAFREATRKGAYPSDNSGPGRSQGETPGAGSIHAARLNERPNVSNPRNRGPEREPSRLGNTPLPVVSMEKRHTGRVSG